MAQTPAPLRLPFDQPFLNADGTVSRAWAAAFNTMVNLMVQRPHAANGNALPVVDGDPVVWDGTSGRLVK